MDGCIFVRLSYTYYHLDQFNKVIILYFYIKDTISLMQYLNIYCDYILSHTLKILAYKNHSLNFLILKGDFQEHCNYQNTKNYQIFKILKNHFAPSKNVTILLEMWYISILYFFSFQMALSDVKLCPESKYFSVIVSWIAVIFGLCTLMLLESYRHILIDDFCFRDKILPDFYKQSSNIRIISNHITRTSS